MLLSAVPSAEQRGKNSGRSLIFSLGFFLELLPLFNRALPIAPFFIPDVNEWRAFLHFKAALPLRTCFFFIFV